MTKDDWDFVVSALVIKDRTGNFNKDNKDKETSPSYNTQSRIDYMLFCEQVLDPASIRNYISSKEKKQINVSIQKGIIYLILYLNVYLIHYLIFYLISFPILYLILKCLIVLIMVLIVIHLEMESKV
jgi:hypothetical protein